MKTAIIIICALVALCSFQTSTADQLSTLQAAIARLKNTAQSTVNDLTRFKSNVQFDLKNKLSNLKNTALSNVNSVVNPALQKIQNSVDAANNEGKNASPCFDSAKATLRTLSLTAFSDLDTCASDALLLLNPNLDSITSIISTGNQIITNLDGIFPSCFSSNVNTMVNCITLALPGANTAVSGLQTAANGVKSTANQTSSSAVNAGNTCNRGPVNNVSQGTTNVIIQANQCIADA